ncbi:P2X purinoceptor 6, partial [Anas platyrhynchos]
VGLLHRLLQLAVLGYLLGWVLVVRRGYQDTDAAPHVSVITKMKGVSVTRSKDASRRLWDVVDYASPPQGENVVFLVTNFIATAKQAQGTCPESPSVLDGMCTEDVDCPVGNPVVHGNGIKTGKCVMFNATHSTCEIYGWCPVENNTLPRKPLLAEAENFTLFIKNTVNFTKFNFSKGNTLQTNDSTYFKSCTYDPFFNPSCPVFRIGDVVEAAGETFGDLALLGGSISIRIEWNCDLDQPSARCQPQYSFILVDRRYNFRTASYYWDSQRRPYRSLMKLYGIRFDISVHGQAGKFSIIPAAVSFGTGIAFFGATQYPKRPLVLSLMWLGPWLYTLPALILHRCITAQATVVCDLVLLYLDTQADFYWKEKFEENMSLVILQAKPPKGKTEAAADPQWADQDIRNAQ